MDKNIYISLTSIFQNQTELLITLKSIMNQTYLPNKIFIYLSEEPYLLDKGFPNKNITNHELNDFIDRNKIIVNWVKNTGPYRKLLPLLEKVWNENCLIITIDDDTEYHKDLIKNLINDYDIHKCVINYRGFTMKFNKLEDINYENRDTVIKKYLYNFPTGKGGILYHPSFFYKTGDLIFNEILYKETCITGDDIWFNFVRICNKIECYIDNKPYMIKDYTTSSSLYTNFNSRNLLNSKNIQQVVKKLKLLGYL